MKKQIYFRECKEYFFHCFLAGTKKGYNYCAVITHLTHYINCHCSMDCGLYQECCISTYSWPQFFKKMAIMFRRCGGRVTHSEELLNSFTMTWKILKTHWNDQAIKKNEDWWHEDDSTTADLLRGPMRGWDGLEGSVLTYCHPSFVYLYSYSWMHKVCFKGKHESWQELMSVKAQRKMTLPVHQGQGWW